MFLLGIGIGVLTNLVTASPDRWPGWAQPVVKWSWLIGAAVVAAVSVRAGWLWFRARLPAPEWTGENPYPGLAAYGGDRAPVFFGRTDDRRDLVRRVQGATAPSLRFVPVVGPSGSGKSSLVLAGLLPALGDRWTVLGPITPGTSGVDELTQLLGTEVRGAAETVLAAVRDGGPAPGPEPVLKAVRLARGTRPRVLLVVDQFEEAAVQHTEKERNLFLALLYALVTQDQRLHVVATVRSEWIGRFQEGPGAGLFTEPFMVNALEPRQIRQVVAGPAGLTDTTFEAGLVEEIVRDTGRGDALPLLSSLLSVLYDGLGRDRYISWADYGNAGKVGGAVAGRAEAAVATSGRELDTTLTTLLLFVDLLGEEPTRRPVWDDTLAAAQRDVVVAFVQAHLLTSDTDPDGRVLYEVTHEALLRQWRPLADHITTHRGTLQRITELLALAKAWVNAGRSTGYLVPVARFADLISDTTVALPEPLAEFATACTDHDETDLQRRANVAAEHALEILDDDPATAISLSLAACTELAPTSTASTALYRSLATGLRHVLTGHSADVCCARVAPDGRLATADKQGTIRIWSAEGTLLHELTGNREPVSALTFGPDGRLASGDAAGRVTVWGTDGKMIHHLDGNMDRVTDLVFAADGRLAAAGHHVLSLWGSDGKPIRRLTGDGERTAVVFAPDALLVTTGENGEIRTWGSSGPEQRRLQPAEESPVTALAVNSDGWIAAGYRNGEVRLWQPDGAPSLSDDSVEGTLMTIAGPVRDLVFSDSGHLHAVDTHRRVTSCKPNDPYNKVTESTDPDMMGVYSLLCGPDELLATVIRGDVRLCVAEGVVARIKMADTHFATVLDFSMHGRLVTATSSTVYVWDINRLARLMPRGAGAAQFKELAVLDAGLMTDTVSVLRADSGRWAVGPGRRRAEADGTTVKVRTADGALIHTLAGDQDLNARHLAFAPDGRLAVAFDHTVRVWDWDGTWLHTLEAHESPVGRMSFAPDGRLVTATTGGALRIWNTAGEVQVLEKAEDNEGTLAFACAEDGRLAAVSAGNTARLWDRDGVLHHSLTGHTEPVEHLAFAPDGALLTAAGDGSIRRWSRDGAAVQVLGVPRDGKVRGLAVTDAGLVVAGGGWDHTMWVWALDGRLLYELLPGDHSLGISMLACGPEGRLITAGVDRVRYWPGVLPLADLITDAGRCALPPLAQALRHRWMLPDESKTT
ncbi:AAA family ATPase [Amycolatopsis sp. Hca4]|uniref:AAA family ATPase n=1 Tax=Amycolatopsis sp. Hca4 TaxID=2742131 RepID=UPI001590F401|nr:AAA family ATPase [Amycolatopsis sp. Hca4]QKV80379.1 hypothetical protein HUT10_46290 [Amycolatopsis sp. Hca4]